MPIVDVHRCRITVDPGYHMGLSVWDEAAWGAVVGPITTALLSIPRKLDAKLEWPQKCEYILTAFDKFLCNQLLMRKVVEVAVEMPQNLESQKGKVAARRDDVIHLAYLVGMMSGTCNMRGVPFRPVPVKEWIGQMHKALVIKRIEKRLGIVYPNHIADSVGLGLYLKGHF